MTTYCQFAPSDPLHGPCHDLEYGFPLADDATLLERLIREINQAGLSWATILKKRAGCREAYRGFAADAVAAFDDADRARLLLADSGVVRNRRKVDAAIENARRIVALRQRHGSFAGWLAAHYPRS